MATPQIDPFVNVPPPGAPTDWKPGAQTILRATDPLSKAGRGVAASTMPGNELVKETALIAMLPAKP